jgi:hypothetical protein
MNFLPSIYVKIMTSMQFLLKKFFQGVDTETRINILLWEDGHES